MYMDEPSSYLTISRFKIYATDSTLASFGLYALFTCLTVTLISVDCDLHHSSFV